MDVHMTMLLLTNVVQKGDNQVTN